MCRPIPSRALARLTRGYALGWAALLCLYCAPYNTAAQSRATAAAEAVSAERSSHGSADPMSTDGAQTDAASSGSADNSGRDARVDAAPGSSADSPGRDARAGAAPSRSSNTALSEPGVVNINTAGAVELERLPRIGPARAQAILALRGRLKQFSRVEQLLQVKGIGRATFRSLRPLLALSGPTTLEHKRAH